MSVTANLLAAELGSALQKDLAESYPGHRNVSCEVATTNRNCNCSGGGCINHDRDRENGRGLSP